MRTGDLIALDDYRKKGCFGKEIIVLRWVALNEDSGRFAAKKDLASSLSALDVDRDVPTGHEALNQQKYTRESQSQSSDGKPTQR